MTRIFLTFLFICLSVTSSTARKKTALLVGVSNYHAVMKYTGWSDLHGRNDVELVGAVLKKQGFSVTSLVDGKATHANIISALRQLINRTTKGDIVYLHFSCHGQPFEDLDGDEADGWDESVVPVDADQIYVKGRYEGKHHLIDDELNRYAERLRSKIGPQGCLYITVDACHSGTAYRGDENVTGPAGDSVIVRGTNAGFSPHGKIYRVKRDTRTFFRLSRAANKSHVTCLEACRSDQRNKEIRRGGRYYGPLSYYIAKVLATHRLDKDNGWVYQVRKLMRKDINVQEQDMVIESD